MPPDFKSLFDESISIEIKALVVSKLKVPPFLILKILLLFILFALVKAIVPRYRYDQLMRLGWKIFLPFSLIYVVLTASYLFYFNLLPTI
mgnify:CR=1 FL=1